MKNNYQFRQIVGLIVILFIAIGPQNVYSQTMVEPIIGYSFFKNTGFSDQEVISNDIVSDTGFDNGNFFVGAGVTQYLSDRISIKVIGQYGKNHAQYVDRGFAGFTDLRFSRLGISAIPTFKVCDKLELGIGMTYQRLSAFELGSKEDGDWTELADQYNQNQLGWTAAASYSISESILFSLRYIDSQSRDEEAPNLINESSSIELALAYRLNVFNKKN